MWLYGDNERICPNLRGCGHFTVNNDNIVLCVWKCTSITINRVKCVWLYGDNERICPNLRGCGHFTVNNDNIVLCVWKCTSILL